MTDASRRDRTTPATGAPGTGTPGTGAETPLAETPLAETPGTRTPWTAESGTARQGTEEPGTGRTDTGKTATGRTATARTDTARIDTGKTDTTRIDTDAADTGRDTEAGATRPLTGAAGSTGTTRTTATTPASPSAPSAPASPLVPHEESDKLGLRLQQAVSGFIDGPRDAVEEADRVMEEVAARFTEAITQRRRTLRTSWQSTDEKAGAKADTEQLRLALKDYRELAERLLHL